MKRRRLSARLLSRLLAFTVAGLVTTMLVALGLTLLVDVQTGRTLEAQSFVDDEIWTVTRFDRAGAALIKSVRSRGTSWGPQQAAGAPDTPSPGDQTTAWASRTSDGSPEWLILEYATAVIPRQVHVYENCAPGALEKVTIFDAADNEIEAWSGNDPSPPTGNQTAIAVSKIPITLNVATKKIKLYLACQKVTGWNEVDAVGLISTKGELQWARHVRASSTYATVNTSAGLGGGQPEELAPSWAGVDRATAAFATNLVNREEQQVDARGWPFLAVCSRSDMLTPSGQGQPVPGQGAQSARLLSLTDDLAEPTTLSRTTSYKTLGPGGTAALTTPGPGANRPPIPFHPIWSGLIANTIFYGVIWLGLWSAMVIPRRFIREVARFRRGACIQCGYDLGYDFIHGCPECGWRRDDARVK
jgi:hypothetical protein